MRNKDIEMMPQEKLRQLQLGRLQGIVKMVYEHNGPYSKKMKAIGIEPGDIKTNEDIRHLPFTTKEDLRKYNYQNNENMLLVPKSKIVQLHTSSGTTGQRTAIGYTKNDIDIWSEVTARSLCAAGCSEDSVIQNIYSYGLATGGLGMHNGGIEIGSTVLPTSTGNTKQQIQLLSDYDVTTICSTPSYALHLASRLEKDGVTLPKLKQGIFGAEQWTEEMRKEIERRLDIDAYNIYGLSEIIGPGVAMECQEKNGSHIWEDHFLPEIVDLNNPEKVLGNGEQGELVLTNLTKDGMPLIRYRTRDITSIDNTPCECGRTHTRLSRLYGRNDDMMIVRGKNIFPADIESAIYSVAKGISDYKVVLNRSDNLDTMEVIVEMSDSNAEINTLLENAIKDNIGINVRVKTVPPRECESDSVKAARVQDNRTR